MNMSLFTGMFCYHNFFFDVLTVNFKKISHLDLLLSVIRFVFSLEEVFSLKKVFSTITQYLQENVGDGVSF